MHLDKVKQYGKHERDRLLRQDEILRLRRELTSGRDWKVRGSSLHIGDEVLECGTAKRAELIALMRNAILQVLNDNVLLRRKLEEKEQSYKRLIARFRNLWERTSNGN